MLLIISILLDSWSFKNKNWAQVYNVIMFNIRMYYFQNLGRMKCKWNWNQFGRFCLSFFEMKRLANSLCFFTGQVNSLIIPGEKVILKVLCTWRTYYKQELEKDWHIGNITIRLIWWTFGKKRITTTLMD